MRRHLPTASFATLVVAISMVASFLGPVATAGARNDTTRASELSDKRQNVEHQIDAAKASDTQLSAELGRLDGVVARRRAAAARARQRAEAAQNAVTEVRAQVERLRKQLAEREHLLEARITDAYIHHGTTALAALPTAGDTALDAARRQTLAVSVAKSDREVVDRLNVTRDDLRAREAALQHAVDLARSRADSARQALADAEASVAEKARVHEALQSRIHDLQAEADALAEQEASIRALLANHQSAQPATNPGGFMWPVRGPITSPYGRRWGRMHTGIDIGVPSGTPIHASKAGVVISAGWHGGYGQLVIVDHGGGYSTFYAHQSRIATHVGQRLSQGAVLGYVGCTGSCTGPHLHFEVRVNGDPRNPLGYLP